MKLFDLIKSANHNLLLSKGRTILTIVAIVVGSFAIISTNAIQTGVNNFIDSQVSALGGDGYIQISAMNMNKLTVNFGVGGGNPVEYDPNEDNTLTAIAPRQIEQVKKIKGIKADSVMAMNPGSASYAQSTKNQKKFQIRPVTIPTDGVKLDLLAGHSPDNSSDEYQIALPQKWVEALGYTSDKEAVGQTLILAVSDNYTKQPTELKAKIVGIEAPSVSVVGTVVNSSLNGALYHENTKYYPESQKSAVYVLAATYDYKNYTSEQIVAELAKINLNAMTIKDIVGHIKVFFDAILTVLRIFGGIALLAAAIGIINTLFMSVQERTREIGLDKALGMSSFKVFLEFSLEAILLGFWGSVFGTLFSMALGAVVNTVSHAPGGVLESFPTFELFKYTPASILPTFILVMAIAFVAGTAPARRASKKDPIEALRYE